MEFTQEIFDRINSFDTIKAGCQAIADETGYKPKTIQNEYQKFRKSLGLSKKAEMDLLCKKIIKKVSENPTNLQEVFREIAKEENKTIKAIHYCYYAKIKNNPDYPIFTIVSKKSGHMNVKNNIGNKYPRHKTNHSFIEQTWGKIKHFINNILK
jgi:hypothetical protein